MSRSYEYDYEIERQRRNQFAAQQAAARAAERAARQAAWEAQQRARRQEYLERISENTMNFYNRYLEQYENMRREGLAAYIPDEMSELESDLEQIRNLLGSDPEAARTVSMRIGTYIGTMRSSASSARSEYSRNERMRAEAARQEKEKKKEDMRKEYFRILRSVNNPVVVNFLINDMQAIREKIESGSITDISGLRRLADEKRKIAESKAEEWKLQKEAEEMKGKTASAIESIEKSISSSPFEDKDKTADFIRKINSLRKELSEGGMSAEEAEKEIEKVEAEIDETLISEATRQEMVKTIIMQLRTQGFNVERPRLFNADGKNYVKITARKPSGKRAVCNIDVHGKIAYKFDNYEAMTCLKDIEKFNVDLEQIYSVKLSDERIIWSNPDKISVDAENIPESDRRKA